MSGFNAGTPQSQARGLARLFRSDKLNAAKNILDSTLAKLIQGLAYEIWRCENLITDFTLEYNIYTTVDLIEQWEAMVGIPDGCIDTDYPIETRRKHVIAKLRANGVSTEQDYIDLAAYLGYAIKIIQLGQNIYPPYDVPFNPASLPAARFIWIIQGHNIVPFVPPYDVPFTPQVGASILQCFFNALKPAETVLIFENI